MDSIKLLQVDDDSPLFNTDGMYYKEFPSDYKLVRFYTVFIVQKAPDTIKEKNLLEQQVSEVIKNAMKHGNKKDISKKVKVWYEFSDKEARIIVEDEGDGFTDLEKWNEFQSKRLEVFESGDFEQMENFISWHGQTSDGEDGGNSLFAAIEYWNQGIIYNADRNKVAMKMCL
jgi:serine/threonine-protein kinase RsbW